MIFELPPAPAGQSYVTKTTANGPTTVLVPTSSLSEDVCAATGRTWEEEARLYNIRNAPDGQPIAKPGDQFYQTAESMKNRGKNVSGAVSAGSLKFFNMINGSSADNPPNLSETIDKIKSGAVNADITASLGKIGEVSGSLPAGASAGLEAAKADIAAKMAKAQADLPKLMAIAQSNVDLLTKKSIAATGKPPSEAEIKAAQGALTIFQDGPKLLEAKAAEISKAVAQAGTDFGAALNKGLTAASDFTKAGLTKVTDLAKTAGGKIAEFASGVPSQTIPDPANPTGPAIPNPAYTAFAAIPANATKITKLADISSKMETAAADLTSKFATIETAQATAVAGGTADLKAFAFAASLAAPVTGLAATVRGFTLDPASFDAASISQTLSKASKLAPSIDTSLYAKTKDEDLTYKGDDGLVWDRVNSERERRSIPGLASIGSPRPLDPPKPEYGTTPPKDPATVTIETKSAAVDATPVVTTATKKKAVFDKDPDEKIFNPFVRAFYSVFTVYDNKLIELEAGVADGLLTRWMDGAYDFPTLSPAARKIIKEKPDPAERTAEEKLLVNQRNFFKQLGIAYSEEYLRYTWVLSRRNELNQQYKILREAFMASKTFGDLPVTVEAAVMKDGGPGEWKKFVTGYYASYAEFAKANPDKAAPPTA